MLGNGTAFLYTIGIALVIFFCRLFPFLIFGNDSGDSGADEAEAGGGKRRGRYRFLTMVEKTVPPVAMTVLAFNALAVPVWENPGEAVPVIAASLVCALLHLWKRNALLSISAGTALYMILEHFFLSQ